MADGHLAASERQGGPGYRRRLRHRPGNRLALRPTGAQVFASDINEQSVQATAAQAEAAGFPLAGVLPHYEHARPGMSVLYPTRRQLPLAVSAFIDFVTEKVVAAEADGDGI